MRVIIDNKEIEKDKKDEKNEKVKKINDLLHEYANMMNVDHAHIENRVKKQRKEYESLFGCRFIFAQFDNAVQATYEGTLFYTDCHYGDNLIQLLDEEMLSSLCEGCRQKAIETEEKLLRTLSEANKHKICAFKSKVCYFEMLQAAFLKIRKQQIYPFQNIGRLTLSRKLDGKQTIKLQSPHDFNIDN